MSMMHLTGVFYLLVLLRVSDAHFPRPCAEPAVLQSLKCCPEYKGSPCGAHLKRGSCFEIMSLYKFWPPPLYTSYCICNGNFDTYDCSRCKPGYKGENCTERQHYVRKEITTLSAEERNKLNNALQMAKHKHSERYVILTREFNDTELTFENASVYNLFVWMHYYAGRAAAEGLKTNAAHKGPAFPFWHRNYLLFMEQEIRDLTGDDTFYIPYWNWVNATNCTICTNELMGESNEDGSISNSSVFSRWETVCTYDDEHSGDPGLRRICAKPQNAKKTKHIVRFIGRDGCTGLPTAAEVQASLKPEEYDTYPYNRSAINSFRNRLEGFDLSVNEKPNCAAMHNLVHDYIGGTMSNVPIAANDPMFMLHHAMIDRLFEIWLKEHRNMTYPKSEEIPPIQRGDSYMRPFFPPVRNDFLENFTAEDLGYSYE